MAANTEFNGFQGNELSNLCLNFIAKRVPKRVDSQEDIQEGSQEGLIATSYLL